jgi:outer membrane protein TolC
VNENKTLVERNLQLLDRAIFEANQYYKNGFIEQLDIDKLQLTMSTLMTQIENLNRQAQLTNSVLKFQMSMPQTDSLVLLDSLKQLMNANLPSDRSATRIEYDLLNTQRELNQLNIKRYKMSRLPTVAAFASASANRQSNKFDMLNPKNGWFPTTLFGLSISLNIYDGGMINAQKQQALIDDYKIKNGIEITKQLIALEIAKAKIEYQNASNQLNSEMKNMELAQKIYDKTRIKYKAGVGSSTEVTQAEGAFFQTQTAYINAIYQLLIAKTDLTAAYGGFESTNQ